MNDKSPTIRRQVIRHVAHKISRRKGYDFGTAFADVLDNLPTHFQAYVDDLYDNGTMLQWSRFKSSVSRMAEGFARDDASAEFYSRPR